MVNISWTSNREKCWHEMHGVKYFRWLAPQPRSRWSLFFHPGKPLRFEALDERGETRVVDYYELSDFLGVPNSRVDLYYCLDRASELCDTGDHATWVEYPTGLYVRDPSLGCGNS